MRLRLIFFLAALAVLFSCSDNLVNPLDINSPNYEQPEIYIDSTSILFADSTAADEITIAISGNKPEVDIRYKLDDGAWTEWHIPEEITVSGFGSGEHTITIEGRYGEGGEIIDTVLSFYRVFCPSIIRDTTDLSAISDTALEIRHGSTCTLTVKAAGTNPLAYRWYQDSVCIDSTSGDTLIIADFQPSDSGSYYCTVLNKWCEASTDTTELKYLPPIQYAPEALPDSFSLNEDDSLVVGAANGLLKNDTDKNNDILTAVLSDSAQHGTILLNSDGSFTYKPDQDFFGIDTFTYQAKDQKEFSGKTKVTITIRSVNDSPVIAKNTGLSVQEGGSKNIAASKLSITDVDHQASALTFTVIGAPKNGELKNNGTAIPDSGTFTQSDIAANTISYQHDDSETTKDTVLFSVRDGAGAQIDTVQIVITITPVNDAPYIQTKNSLSVVESGIKAIGNIVLLVKDNDNPSSEITFSMVKLPVNGKLLKQGNELDVGETFTQEDIDSQRVSYRHNGGNTDRDSLSFTIADEAGASISETTFRINIGLTDDPPVALDDLDNSLNEDGNIVLTFIANDPEEKPIVSYEIVSNPKHGTLTATGSSRTYTPALNFNGTDTLTFRASDGSNWSNVAMVVITVIPQNDKPEWKQQNKDLEVKEGKTVTFDLNTVFDKDPDGDQVTFAKKSGVGTIGGDGKTWSWAPNYSAAQNSPATCVIIATDNGTPAMSSDITLTITVTDSLCVLTTTVLSATGSGTIGVSPAAVSGTSYDPNTIVSLTANKGTDYVFKNWSGDIGSADPFSSSIQVTMSANKSISAIFVKAAETVTLNIGESYVHALIHAEGYFFATTRTYPAKLLRFNSNNLSDYAEITFSSGHNQAEQIVYAASTGKLYTSFETRGKVVIAEIDPITLQYVEEKIVDTTHSTEGGLGHTLTTDGSYLYVTTYQSGGQTEICKYSLSTFSGTPVKTGLLDASLRNGHAIQVRDGVLYMTGATSPPWVAKVDANELTVIQSHFLSGGVYATDDFAMTDNYLFVSTESTYSDPYSGVVFRIDLNNLANVYEIRTGAKGGAGAGGGQCFSAQYNGEYVWVAFASSPGTLTKIDPVSLEYTNYQLAHNTPNEIAWDGKRLFITYWAQNPGRVQAFEPSYLNGREVPISVAQN